MSEATLKELIDSHGVQIGNNTNRITKLEINSGKLDVQLSNLVQSVQGLTNMLRTILYSALAGSVGFVIWFIQTH